MFNGAFLGVLLAGVDIGLAIGIGMSVLIALWHTAFPKTVRLGQLPNTNVYRHAYCPPLCIVRLDVCNMPCLERVN